MKRLIVTALFLALLSATAEAQIERYKVEPESGTEKEKPEGRTGGGERLARMQKNLDLSDEQVEQLREIRERGGTREDVRAVFTDEQWAKMQERRRQGKNKRAEAEPGRYYTQPADGQAKESDEG